MLRSKIGAIVGALVLVCGCAATRPIVQDVPDNESQAESQPDVTVVNARPQAPAPAKVTTTGAEVLVAASAPVVPGGVGGFNRALAGKLIGAGVERAKACHMPDGPTGKGHAVLTFGSDGSVLAVELDAPFRDTEVGLCVALELQKVFVDPFSGDTIAVGKTFEIAPIQP